MIAAVEAQRELLGNRTSNPRFNFDFVQIAIAALDITTEFELWLLRGDIQRTSRSVATEQCTLWSAKHFDAFDWRQFGKRDTGARTEYAVDEHADGRFKTGIVASGTNTADRKHRTSR